jgi:hypothetical protein
MICVWVSSCPALRSVTGCLANLICHTIVASWTKISYRLLVVVVLFCLLILHIIGFAQEPGFEPCCMNKAK